MQHRALTHQIIGAAMEVHSFLGNGFPEVIYQRSLAHELSLRGISYAREFEMEVHYKEAHVGTRRVDFLIEGIISTELKAVIKLEDVHLAQGLNYLEALNLEVGLLLNFGATRLEYKRLLNKKYQPIAKPR
ncbi:GxxExxY protein [Flavilitoribacter nigricans]|uniref:GxxExxY protein n=1 Tax=Flavilitoribacter nigricans (strain ATCC 23147 / DSM 23189 / NBRC 102662 / NCIMB 1420 / SS-2) TaxID=1122177 RepID=A0A2D0NF81_FLAN2|nr:GxxExxY protein [Flavilitoribacter nigricans]PHN06829.1 GxxExxY protein [Flavilitoribacter nigricans DSM 23189 = NBRC 102662]